MRKHTIYSSDVKVLPRMVLLVIATFIISWFLSANSPAAEETEWHHRRYGGERKEYAHLSNITSGRSDAGTAYVEFEISWDASWRDGTNHDAAWVFFKVQEPETEKWKHVRLKGSGLDPQGYDAGEGTDIELIVPNDRTGLFVRRADNGTGELQAEGVRVQWDTEDSGVEFAGDLPLRGFAVEMVYVHEGPFYLGTGGPETNAFHLYTDGTQSSEIFKVYDPDYATYNWGDNTRLVEDTIAIWHRTGALWGVGSAGKLHQEFPTGYEAFYCMKYPITEGQWVDFFNMLTPEQKRTRDIIDYHITYGGKVVDGVRNRNTIRWDADAPESDATTDAPHRACNFLAWADGTAFAAWAGLRPMGELEYEKACRGPLDPVPDEYAWGTDSVRGTDHILAEDGYVLSEPDTPQENLRFEGQRDDDATVDWRGMEQPADGNALWQGTARNTFSSKGFDGPVRVGVFQKDASSRTEAGATFWGIMDMSGHLWERVVSVNRDNLWRNHPGMPGRRFRGTHGDGTLTDDGEAGIDDWPGADARGAGFRGGSWRRGAELMRVSDRTLASLVRPDRHKEYGWRGVRTAPDDAKYPTTEPDITSFDARPLEEPETPDFEITWVDIPESNADYPAEHCPEGVGFTGEMSRYPITNAQYAQFLNQAFGSEDIEVDGNHVVGAADRFKGEKYYRLDGPGRNTADAVNGGKSRIRFEEDTFTVESGLEEHPVTYVSWYGAVAFAERYGWRLPDEWEWASVANYNDGRMFPTGGEETVDSPGEAGVSDEDSAPEGGIAREHDGSWYLANNWFYQASEHGTTPVGYFGTYGYGLAEMEGNVWEWTSSLERSAAYPVLRGGGWHEGGAIFYRGALPPSSRLINSGFRVCR